ncbi:hypothetical protein KJ765_05370 [Candidatus Micrarchaeota archaeon]|nr:hypothetical protein [Candidatus Micrarchaeota archaeon]
MYRILWFKIGGQRVHLLKLAGAFLIAASLLKVAEASYSIFVVANKIVYAQLNPNLIPQLFGWAISAPFEFGNEDVIGVMMGPLAGFVFWLGLATVALIIYQSGKIVFPVEEYDERVTKHHRKLLERVTRLKKRR